MTTLRPERPADGPMSYDTGQFEVVVGQLDDPLNDPLPGRPSAVGDDGGPPAPGAIPAAPAPPAPPAYPHRTDYADYADYADYPDYAEPAGPQHAQPPHPRQPLEQPHPQQPMEEQHAQQPHPRQSAVDVTARMPVVAEPPAAEPVGGTDGEPGDGTVRQPALGPPSVDGGRAARRKAAAKGGGGHRAKNRGPGAAAAPAAQEAAAPLSRIEARRAAKAAKESPSVVISRVVGELFITTGVLMLLFVTYQLWWTNVRAHAQANSASNKLEQQWNTDQDDPNRAPGTFSPGQGFAIMYIPKLDVKAPIAQGVSKSQVLDKGMVGHYDGALNTAMPWDKTGNFAVAAHRNTHGEPFRYINHLVPGDKVVVETSSTYYTYEITSSLPTTPPSNTSVLQPIPVGSGFTQPGRYLTLTTCTPEFTSTNRLIVWGKLVEQRPRSKGKPDALVNG